MLEIIILLAIVFAVRAWYQRTLVSGEAPDFDEITLQNEQIMLADYRGKPLMLHFWASWCATCEFEQDSISRIHADWPVVTVAFSSGETEEVSRYVERKGIGQWSTIVDSNGELTGQYGVMAVPTTFIIDGKGVIRFKEVGLTSGWGLRFRLWLTETFFKGV